MFREIRDHIINIVTSRLTVLMILFAFFAGVLLYRCFHLQIVNGEEYLNDFILQIEKTRDISSTRGRILDRNGNVLAENELAYSVKIEDVFESSRNKNAKVNDVVYRLIKLIEKNGDSVITDFKIVIDEDGDYAYSVEGTALLRFQADVLGYRTVDKLSEEEKAMTAQELMEYLSRAKGFAIGQYEDPEDSKTPFVPGKGYTKEEWLQMVTIRYAMNLTSFRKYVGTTVATNVSAETVAVIMENSDQLDGVSIVEDTVRHYIDSKYFAHVLGYTGKISSDELTELNDQVVAEGGLEDTYTINDVVGKSGMEAYMETTLQGTKGSEKVVVDNTGKVITILERKEAQPGADVYLTIDKDLTEAVYNIVEQKLAGLVASKIINAKEFNLPENAKSSSIKIPIYDVYFAMINNNILDRKHFEAEDEEGLYSGKLSAYQFMMNRINNLEITPAQLALDPCNASVVITDVNTGDVLAMVSYPGYDNNKMTNTVDAEYYAQLNADKSSPQLNFATQYKAAPGSTFKIVSATAGLMENVINLQTRVNCVGTFTEITPSPRCWRISGHGYENVTSAIKDSCNYFFYNVGFQLATRYGSYDEEAGLNTLSKYADLYGLTDKSGVEIGEYAPDVSTKDPVRSAIGQGSNSYTTVGLARYVTTIANSGTCYNLTLLDKTTDSQGNLLKEYHAEVRNQIDLPQEYWDAFHLGMRQVVENKAYFNDLAVNAAGKTGTAEQTASRPNHALFICYAPYENPEIAIATRIPFGYSSDYAAQFTRDIIKYYYGLAEEDDLITGTADTLDNAVSNEM